MLKPFIPQLQTTFIKALQDSTRGVRSQAATALGQLMTLNTKVDSLITELLNGLSTSASDIQETMLTALQLVLLKGGKSVSGDMLNKVGSTLVELLASDEESTRTLVGKSIGAYSKYTTPQQLDELFTTKLLVDQPSWQTRNGCCLAVKAILRHSPQVFERQEKLIITVLAKYCSDEKPQVRQGAAEALGKVLLIQPFVESSAVLQVLTPVIQLLGDSANDVKLAALKALKKCAKRYPNVRFNFT